MRSLWRFFMPALAVALVIGIGVHQAADKPKLKIEEIMEKAHDEDNGLLKKILADKGTKADKQMLLDLYKDLALNKPPKGDAKSWEEKTKALVTAAQAAVSDAKDYKDQLKKAANCDACHKAHQP
jgi:hypothetical protein